MSTTARPTLAYILKGYPRISETFISNEILLLEKLGMRMRLFPMRKPRENFSHDSVKQISAKVSYLPTDLLANLPALLLANMSLAVKCPVRYAKALCHAGVRFSRTRKIATLKHLLQAGYMVNNHLLHEPEVVHLHGHFAHSPTSVTMFASMLSGLPFSFTAHAKDIYTSNREQLREKIRLAQFVTTCTQHNVDYLRNLADDISTPIHCIYHGIDLDLFQSEQHPYQSHSPYTLLTVARMTEKKGLPTIYRALALLKQRGYTFHHTLIGDGDDRAETLSLITQLNLDDCCSWLGTQTHTEVLNHFKKSDLFVLGCEIAKNGDRDGIPNVLVESLAMGVPALSTTVSAIPEILINKKTGMTVPAQDSTAMADAIEKILTDQELRKEIISQGLEFVRNNFDNRQWIEQLADVFHKENPSLSETAP